MKRKIVVPLVFVIVLAGGAWAFIASGWTLARVQASFQELTKAADAGQEKPKAERPHSPRADEWDGTVTLDEAQRKAIGLQTAIVKVQDEPTKLELIATTDYDPNTLTKVRPPLDLRVEKVYKAVGDRVKAGEPVLDVYSSLLAAAKTSMEKEFSEWQHDHRLMESRKELFEKGSITKQAWADIVNDEYKSEREYIQARKVLQFYGLTDKEIDKVFEEDGAQQPKMTIRSLADGIVIQRDAVPLNLYKTDDQLLVIAPLDRLWVHVSVPEGDAYRVQLGLSVRVIFPYNHLEFAGEVEHIYNQIDPVTRSVKFRTSVPNYEGQLRAGMYVRATLLLPPPADMSRTVVPRNALVTADGANYVFIQESDTPGKFHRKAVQVVEEYHDVVYIADSLRAEEVVATSGSLILAQLYEDLQTQH